MLTYTIRRTLVAIPTLLFISFIIFIILDLAPNDPTGNLPMTITPEVRQQIRDSLGLDEPMYWRFLLWLNQFFVNEPLNILAEWGWVEADESRLRVRSWATRSPIVDLIVERAPQTLWVVGSAFVRVKVPLPIPVSFELHSSTDPGPFCAPRNSKVASCFVPGGLKSIHSGQRVTSSRIG